MSEMEPSTVKATDADADAFPAADFSRRKPDLATRVAAEQVRLLLDLGETSRYTVFGGILVVGLAFYQTAPVWATGVVMLFQLVAQILFDRVRSGFRADPDALTRATVWAKRYTAVTLISGSTWGVGGLLWLPGSSFAQHIFYALVLSCLSMSTAITRAAFPAAVIAYISMACAPTMILLILSGDPLGFATVALSLLFLLTLSGWTRRVNRSYAEAFRLRFENADLIERMARAHAATEQKRSDAEQAERRARAANRAKTEFLDILGHQVRMPLDTLARMARQLRDEPLTDAQRNLAQSMTESSQMLRRLFDDMVDFSQMEARSLELKPRSFDPHEIAKGVVRLMRPEAKERGLSLELDFVPGTPPSMVADPDRLRQVLVNLVSNAIKFTETGGVILRVQPVTFGRADPTPALRFSVLDTGIGLTPDAQARLFESFTQGEAASGSGRPGGMGLGLAICDRLIGLMGGQIQVDSAPGQGSTFWFLLPQEPGHSLGHAPEIGRAEPERLSSPERLIDHDYLYELERELGAERITDHMVAALARVLDLQAKIEAARSQRDTVALGYNAEALQREAAEIGLIAVSEVAREIGDAVERGREDNAIHDVPRLQQKISATWRALSRSFPSLHG
ncbi:MAG: ATP-binding protein [Parvibaculum sp.]|uniref:sensor histidine kinase n=1 Tax=Parvibaculum sp. TaxID=2024848 RepID=UPI00284E8828|nr:ATP-binding protein [Parvibaculum sp.]MDR3498860.1 ATP-binding protein [Parvibaculum sp.]